MKRPAPEMEQVFFISLVSKSLFVLQAVLYIKKARAFNSCPGEKPALKNLKKFRLPKSLSTNLFRSFFVTITFLPKFNFWRRTIIPLTCTVCAFAKNI